MFDFQNQTRSGYEPINDEVNQTIDSNEPLNCVGYKPNKWKILLYYLLNVLFCGIPYLIQHWYCQYAPLMKFSRCALSEAKFLLLKDLHENFFLKLVHTTIIADRSPGESRQIRYFHLHHVKYVWDNENASFSRLLGLEGEKYTIAQLLDHSQGLTLQEQQQKLQLYGKNVIDIEVKSYWTLFVEEVFNPFYVFQIFSVILWSLDDYYYYASCVLVLSAISIITSLIQTKKQSLALYDLVASSNAHTVTVCYRDGHCKIVEADLLVPGDRILIPPHGCHMTCDALLLSGNCIVNESMLTGECVPVTKTPPSHSDEIYDPNFHKRHTLFSGTHVIQTRFYGNNKVTAVVIRTGFYTSKGELIRSILFPKPVDFKFYSDAFKFVVMLFCVALIGMAYCIYLYVIRFADIETILLRTLDIVTIVVPPALPAAMTVGTVYSLNRLKKLKIFCIAPPKINICGKVKLVCFDKTGTLTEDGLDIWGVLGCENSKFHSSLVSSPLKLDVTSPLVAAMATCHTLTNIEGKLTGDPLDLTMFEATQWDLIEPGQDTNRYDMLTPTVVKPMRKEYQDKTKWVGGLDMETSEIPYEIGIVRQFPFSSSRQCMTVIARTLGSNHMTLYCKGAPEKISCLCKPNSIPEDFGSVLMNFTSAGYRVIALSYKPMDLKFNWLQAQKIKREQVETDLEFIGLLITQNMLKPESLPVIQELTAARIRCVMATGDNILTAVSVARNCGMVLPNEWVIQVKAQAPDETHSSRITYKILDTTVENSYAYSDCMSIMECEKWHFALDGKSWAAVCSHFPELLPYILTKGIVFSRMGPDQKTQLVEYLQNLDYIVAMCGDGANDCGALKAAHIGISLSEAEASVAAPFTSQIANIKCVLHLIREGRCALVTSFGVFKFMALYSLIQFISVLLLYMHGTMLGNVQFLYIDLVITTTLAVVMGRTGPTSKLVPQRPLGSLVAAVNVIPLLLQIVLTLVVQVAALYFLIQQDWFQPISPKDGEELIQCWENTSVFCVSCYQYLILATIYSKGYPYRNPFYTNSLFLLTLLSLTVFTTFLLVNPIDPLAEFFELMPLGEHKDMKHFRLWLLVLPLIHLISALIIEVYIANTKWLKDLVHFLTRKRVPKNKYKRVSEMTPTKLHWIAEIT